MFPVRGSITGFVEAYCASECASASNVLEVAYDIRKDQLTHVFRPPHIAAIYNPPRFVPIGVFDHPISDKTLFSHYFMAISNYHVPAGEVLQIWRGELSRSKVASDLGIPVRTLEAYEQSRRSLMDASFSTVVAFVRFYGLTFDHIIALYAGASSVDSGLDA